MTSTSFSNKSQTRAIKHWETKMDTFHSPYLFDQVPGEAMIGGELQAHLRVNVRGGLTAAAHDQ